MKVYLIRHGLTDAILDGQYCGSTDMPVNRKGILVLRQNADKGLYPSGNLITQFAVSTLSRTTQTLQTIYGTDLEFIADPDFSELDFGDYEMKTHADLKENLEYKFWIDHYIEQGPPHGESVDTLWARIIHGLEELNVRNKNAGDVLIVSHGISIATILNKLFAYPLLSSIPQPGEGYVVEIGFTPNGKLLPSASRFIRRISDLEKNETFWQKPKNFSYFTNKKSTLTLLHANDFHGQFLFHVGDDLAFHGGISLLSGYVKKIRQENPNMLFTISGDLMEKSLLEKTVKGLNAVDVCNYLAPDLVTLGNHELNYGLSQLMLFEKCVDFPVINANVYNRYLKTSLFPSYDVKTVDGVRMMFIGIMDKPMFQKMPLADYERETLEYRDSLAQIIHLCGLYKTPDVDLVILLSHIGLDQDCELARRIPKECGVNIILGGHSHILMKEPIIENDIMIVQSSYGSDHIGKLEITFDHQKQAVDHFRWELVSINSETCPFDKEYDTVTDEILASRKKNGIEILCTFAECYTHEKRYNCTPLGRLISDSFLDIYAVDMVWFPSKNIRTSSCGPTVTYMNLLQMLPYDGGFVCIELTGEQIVAMMYANYPNSPQVETIIPLQTSKGFEVVQDCKTSLLEVRFQGEDLSKSKKKYIVGLPAYVYERLAVYFGEEPNDVRLKKRILSTSMLADLVAYFKNAPQPLTADTQPRLTYLNREWRIWR